VAAGCSEDRPNVLADKNKKQQNKGCHVMYSIVFVLNTEQLQYLRLTSDKMSAVNLLSEFLDVRARRLKIYRYNTNEIDCLISSVCSD